MTFKRWLLYPYCHTRTFKEDLCSNLEKAFVLFSWDNFVKEKTGFSVSSKDSKGLEIKSVFLRNKFQTLEGK
ncbi:chromosome 14 open reading frame 142, isoform CRA_a [Homo sapiens]